MRENFGQGIPYRHDAFQGAIDPGPSSLISGTQAGMPRDTLRLYGVNAAFTKADAISPELPQSQDSFPA